ncbi:hypothetical protein F8388_009029 [Cannabis sativa]|uniref:Uncharacterized protein n=1 Tax=Cannabis sativa TaxID=3483 RepID=A0A7J6GJK1_CANSA|nr:hypothetical protein G4B88_022995 [Cannabis sativa]KAF4382998.1 hypothetical protein F8388_009029 [Cannabis sativa]
MERDAVVFDISSDEEEFTLTETKGDDFDWLAEYLEAGDKGSDNDSDDVVVVGETKPKSRSKSSKPTVRDADEDCVVLDGDPDKKTLVGNDDAVSDSDELCIVGEKGPVACRDFPHSRHVCISFPFNTTPHEKHCSLCHCYVCDLPAPCVHWATSTTSIGHCHATDKEDLWKIQRKNFKSGKISSLPPSKISASPLSVCVPKHNHVSPPIIQLSPCSRPNDFVSRPSTVQGCSSANFALPTIISRGRSQQSGMLSSKNRFQPYMVPGGPRMVRGGPMLGASHTIRKGPLSSTHAMFKRQGNVGVTFPRNQTLYPSSNTRSRTSGATQYPRIHTPAPALANLADLSTIMLNEINSLSRQNSYDPNFVCAALNTPTSEPQTYNQQHIPPSNIDSQNMFHQHSNQFQNNDQTILNPRGDETQKFVLDEDIEFIGAKDVSSVDCSLPKWLNDTNQSNQQPPVENTQHPNAADSFFAPSVKDSNSQFSIRNTDLRFDDWIFEDRNGPVVADGSMAPSLDVISPEPAPIDPGMLFFDFEPHGTVLPTHNQPDRTDPFTLWSLDAS